MEPGSHWHEGQIHRPQRKKSMWEPAPVCWGKGAKQGTASGEFAREPSQSTGHPCWAREQLAPSDGDHFRKPCLQRALGQRERGRTARTVREEAGGGTGLISRPQAHLTLSNCYISEGACVGAIISGPAIQPLASGNEDLDEHLGGRRRQEGPLSPRLLPCHWHLILS